MALSGKANRGRKARAASRGVPVPRGIPDSPDRKVRAASQVRKASRVRRADRARAARPARRASPVRKASVAREAKPDRPGQLPSIEQVMPWLHLVFDAYEDYKRARAREAVEPTLRAMPNARAAVRDGAERGGSDSPMTATMTRVASTRRSGTRTKDKDKK